MKKILPLLLLAASLASCEREADSLSPATLVGSWRLTDKMCYCEASPLPDEVLTFATDQHFQLFRSGTLAAEGTYSLSRSPSCGETIDRDQLRLATTAKTYVPTGAYTVQGQTLIIDQTNECVSDGPIYTYTRQP